MDSAALGRSYDGLGHEWQELPNKSYGIAQFERAIQFAKNRGVALDIGCGSQGRMIEMLIWHGFQPEGIDVSAGMIALVRRRHPNIPSHEIDVCRWEFPKKYDFISAWDNAWHLPLDRQEPVLKKICGGSNAGGVYIFTTGGLDAPVQKSDSCMGVPLGYSVLKIPQYLELLTEFGCVCRHLEYDPYPEQHLCIIAPKLAL